MDRSTLDTWEPLLTIEERAYLGERSSMVTYERRSVIIHKGEDPGFVLYLDKGYVQAVSPVTGLIASIRRPGDIVGEIGPLRRKPRSTDVVAMTFVEALLVPAPVWIDFISTHLRALGAHYLALTDRFVEEEAMLGEPIKDGEDRVVHAIGKLLQTDMGLQCKDGSMIFENITQSELGNMAGLSRESVSNILRRMKKRGLVSTRRGSIIVIDSEEITRLYDRLTESGGAARHVES